MAYLQERHHEIRLQVARLQRSADMALTLGSKPLMEHIDGRLADLLCEIKEYIRTGKLPTDEMAQDAATPRAEEQRN